MGLHLRRTLTKWGNGWGIRLTKKEVEALGLKPGQAVEVDLSAEPPRNWVDQLPAWDLGVGDINQTYDEDLEIGPSLL